MADARRSWARALHTAISSGPSQGVESDLEAAALALEGAALAMDGAADSTTEAFFLDPAIPAKARVDALAALMKGSSPQASEVWGRFARLLVEKRRVTLVPAIARVFRSILDRDQGVARLELSSARELDGKTLAGLSEAWKTASGSRSVVVTTLKDPALMGGFILRAGSVRYDWSTAGRLKRLGEELARPLDAAGE